MSFLDNLTGTSARITAGIAMAVSIAVGLWHGFTNAIDAVRLGAVVTTSLAWLLAEVASGRRPSAHDLALFGNIIQNLPRATTDFLRDQDFHNSFNGKQQGGLFELATWEGSRHQFLDRAMEKRWAPLLAQIKSFTGLLAINTGPIGGGPLFTAHPENGNKDFPEPWVVEKIESLNQSAASLIKAVDCFETYGRNRLQL